MKVNNKGAMMRIFKLAVGPFEMNSYIVAEDQSENCLLIDPGDEPDRIFAEMENKHLKPQRIVLTHAHIDHVRYLAAVKDALKIPVFIHENDLPLLEGLNEQALFFGLDTSPVPEVDGFLQNGDVFRIGKMEFKVLHTPGHSPGSICLYSMGHVFVGDVLFKESIGRADLYGGNLKQLIRSIKENLLTLPDETVVHPGHGKETTIGQEKSKNPFLQNLE